MTYRTWRLGALVLASTLIAAGAASAQTLEDYDYDEMTFDGLGLDYGYIWPNRVEPASTYTLRADLGYLGPGVRVVPSVSYWTSTLDGEQIQRFADQLNQLEALRALGSPVDRDDLAPIDWSGLALNVDMHVVWEAPLAIFPYVGLGVGAHAMNGSGPAIAGTFIEDLLDSVSAGAAAMAGIEHFPAPWLRLYAEGRYAVLNDLRYPAVRIGTAFRFTGREQ